MPCFNKNLTFTWKKNLSQNKNLKSHSTLSFANQISFVNFNLFLIMDSFERRDQCTFSGWNTQFNGLRKLRIYIFEEMYSFLNFCFMVLFRQSYFLSPFFDLFEIVGLLITVVLFLLNYLMYHHLFFFFALYINYIMLTVHNFMQLWRGFQFLYQRFTSETLQVPALLEGVQELLFSSIYGFHAPSLFSVRVLFSKICKKSMKMWSLNLRFFIIFFLICQTLFWPSSVCHWLQSVFKTFFRKFKNNFEKLKKHLKTFYLDLFLTVPFLFLVLD